ncbi:MAG: FtsQ-type POTRA domain-containing protein [Leptolinea sp.]|nr:FtsQ-type POTRA domain-containing protein [Leptolinea sp.]
MTATTPIAPMKDNKEVMTGITDIFTPKPRNASVQQAVPRENKKFRRSLLDMLFGPGRSSGKTQAPQYPVVKPIPGIDTQPVHPVKPGLNSLSRLFGIKPDKTPLENLQDQIKKEKVHGETGIKRFFRKMHISPAKDVSIMPSRAALKQTHTARGVVMPNRVIPSTVRSINSPLSRNSFLGKINLKGKSASQAVVTTFVKPAPVEEPVPVARPKNIKEWIKAFRTNITSIHLSELFHPKPAARITPIVARHAVYGVPVHRQAQSKVRRQLYLSLGKSGAEIRVPALPIFNPSWRFISGILTIACSACMAYMIYAPQFLVTSVEVKGLNRLDPERIQPILDLANRPIVFLDADMIRNRVSQVLPELKDIRVSIELPATISITLGERKPALVWDNNGEISWIDTDGILIPVQGEGGELLTILANVPPPVYDFSSKQEIVKARAAAGVQFEPRMKRDDEDTVEEPEPSFPGMQQVDQSVLSTAVQLSMMMPVGAQLIYDSKYGFGWNDQLQSLTVYIGQDLTNLNIKMNEYSAIMMALQKDGIKPGMISLEHVHAPFYRLERH